MKKILLLPLWALTMLLCTSCDFYMSDNGQLDGFWQLACIDTIGGGSIDARSQRLFWSVQCDLLQVSDLNYAHDTYVWRFDHSGSMLHLHAPYHVDRAGSDIPVSNAEELRPYGIQTLDETFDVERLDADGMTLRSPMLRLRFRRY